jgi:hypothetical protein
MFRLDRRRWVGLAALVGLLAYIGWMAGPYLRSVILRDAAVTSWINHTASPIAGYVGLHPLYPGERIGADGLIAAIEDPLADRSALTRSEADLERAKQRRKSLEQLVALRQSTADARATVAQTYAETFKQDLETRITAASGSLSLTTQRLGLERVQADRLAKLAASGHGSQSAADAEAQLVVELQKTQTGLQSELDRSTQRRSAAELGTFLLEDGTDAAVASRALDEPGSRSTRPGSILPSPRSMSGSPARCSPQRNRPMTRRGEPRSRRRPAPSSGALPPRRAPRSSPEARWRVGSIAV